MSGPLLLPTPLSTRSISLGQLLRDPLDPTCSTFHSKTTDRAQNEVVLTPDFSDIINHDNEGRFKSTYLDRSPSRSQNLIAVSADKSLYTSLAQPVVAFNTLEVTSSAFQEYLRKGVAPRQQLYFVTGLQTLQNPSFKRAVQNEGSIAEATPSEDHKLRLPMHVRRDSAMELTETDSDVVLGVELLKVKCMLGRADEPHHVDDIDYVWSYKTVGEDLQLAIGLGKSLEARELRAMAGIAEEDDWRDGDFGGYYDISEDEDDGLAGFQ